MKADHGMARWFWGQGRLLGVFLVLSCASAPVFTPDTSAWVLESDEEALVQQSPAEATRISGQLESRFGGVFTFFQWQPRGQIRGRVVFAHGFLRNAENMAGWGDWLAGLGYEVAIPNFIHSSLLGGNHDKNGQDLLDLAQYLWPDRERIYGGVSAGALASLLAASKDPLAAMWIGLDPVDSGNLASEPTRRLLQRGVKTLVFLAEPGACNAQNNFVPVWIQQGGRQDQLILTRGTTHHVFESPYDPSLEGLCGRMVPPESVAIFQRWLRYQILENLGPPGPN